MRLFSLKPVRGAFLTALTLLVLTAGASRAEEMPELPKPAAEHQWLQQFVGEWESETEAYMEPGKPPVRSKGTESVRPLGGFWTISEIKGDMMGSPFMGNLTLGYDPEKQKYVGTWVDSMTGRLWNYEGAVDASGKSLTLETEGTCPMRPGKLTKFKEVLEVKDKNHKLFSSSMQDENGQWVTMMTSQAKRKK
jgi:hypothetical protein